MKKNLNFFGKKLGDDVLSNVPFKLKMNFKFLDTVTIIIQGYNFLSYFSNCKINQTLQDRSFIKEIKTLTSGGLYRGDVSETLGTCLV